MAEQAQRREARVHATNGLVDLLDRVLSGGAVVSGDLVVALAGVDLLYVDLRLLAAPAEKLLAYLVEPEDEDTGGR